ncbi:hypothetical protein IAU59_007581 [Kwoniella sp. CBS 9459]
MSPYQRPVDVTYTGRRSASEAGGRSRGGSIRAMTPQTPSIRYDGGVTNGPSVTETPPHVNEKYDTSYQPVPVELRTLSQIQQMVSQGYQMPPPPLSHSRTDSFSPETGRNAQGHSAQSSLRISSSLPPALGLERVDEGSELEEEDSGRDIHNLPQPELEASMKEGTEIANADANPEPDASGPGQMRKRSSARQSRERNDRAQKIAELGDYAIYGMYHAFKRLSRKADGEALVIVRELEMELRSIKTCRDGLFGKKQRSSDQAIKNTRLDRRYFPDGEEDN